MRFLLNHRDPFNTLESIVYKLIKYFLYPFQTKTMLILKVDSFGDYILMRNFLYELVGDTRYSKYRFILCGNIVWKEFAETFDSKLFYKFIWLSRKQFEENKWYRFKKVIYLLFTRAKVLLHPTHSRDATFTEIIVQHSGAKEVIGSSGDDANINMPDKIRADHFYTKIIECLPATQFEFSRNRDFFEKLLQRKIVIQSPTLELIISDAKPLIKIGIFPGAAAAYRQWKPELFAKLCILIHEVFPSAIFEIFGGASDIALGKCIENLICNESIKVLNNVKQTKLSELAIKLGGLNLLISNDTGAAHLAVAVGTPLLCISNGTHFGRFNPYAVSKGVNVITLYPPSLRNKIRDKPEELAFECRRGSSENINTITPEEVCRNVVEMLNKTLFIDQP